MHDASVVSASTARLLAIKQKKKPRSTCGAAEPKAGKTLVSADVRGQRFCISMSWPRAAEAPPHRKQKSPGAGRAQG